VTRLSSVKLLSGLAILVAIGFGVRPAPAQGSAATVPVPGDLAGSVKDLLQPTGVKVAGGSSVVEVYPLKSVSVGSAAPAGGAGDVLYPGLTNGELVGVVHFPGGWSDFRGQAIKPGYYTLRYGLMPQDGNHMGANANRDFLLLSPLSLDTQLNQPLKPEDLFKLSKRAPGTNHPGVMDLVPVASGAALPSVTKNDQGYTVLQFNLAAGGKSLPIAVVIVGQTSAG